MRTWGDFSLRFLEGRVTRDDESDVVLVVIVETEDETRDLERFFSRSLLRS